MKKRYLFLVLILCNMLLCASNADAQTYSFAYTGGVQPWTVPAGVSSVVVSAKGAKGGYNSDMLTYQDSGGHGACVVCTLAVTAGTVLNVYVGGAGGNGTSSAGGAGGYNGGAAGNVAFSTYGGGGGGGASDVRVTPYALANRKVIAGGGGGAGLNYSTYNYDKGGDGGGTTGENGWGGGSTTLGYGGYGGSTVGGGGGTYPGYGTGSPGTLGIGGLGASGTSGGGGGGGYYGGGGGSWAGGGGGSSWTDPVSVTGTVHTRGCNLTDNGHVDITVLCAVPVPGAIVGGPTVCEGANITLTDPTGSTGGVWTSTNTAAATVNSTSGVVTGVAAGTTTISYSVVRSCGSAYISTVITVNPIPAPITGVTDLCQGSSLTADDATVPGTWSESSGGTVVAVPIPTVGLAIGVGAGTALITYTIPTGCFVTTSVLVTAVPVPITGPTSVCMTYPVTLGETSVGGTWSSSDPTVATIGSLNGLVTPVAPGTTDITYSNGCGSAVMVTVTVNPLPAAITGTRFACVGGTTTLSSTTSGGTWTSFATGVATVDPSTGVVTGVSAGFDRITYTLNTGCFVSTSLTITPPVSTIAGPGAVCTGSSIPLSVTITGGTWSSSSAGLATVGTTSGIVTGVSMGIATITYSIGTGCSALKQVTVNPIAPILGRDSVCVGSRSYLTDIVGGGVWSSSNTGVATVSVDSGLVSGLVPGITYINYLLPTGCSAKDTVMVIALPPAITGTSHVCPGSTVTLLDADFWGNWQSNDPTVATVSNAGVVTGINADTVTISYIIGPGCKANKLVTVNPLPQPINGKTIDCPGIIDTLTDPTPGGIWTSLTPALGTVDPATGVISTLAGGSATFKYTLPTGCSRTKTISIYPVPGPAVTYNWYDQTFYTDTGYVSYQWYDSIQGMIPGATSPTLAALYNEYYWVVVTDKNGCKGASARFHFDATQLGVAAVNRRDVMVYPNPTTGIVYIDTKEKVRAVISAMDGKMLMDKANATELNISGLANGTYFIALYDAKGQIISVQKLVKQE